MGGTSNLLARVPVGDSRNSPLTIQIGKSNPLVKNYSQDVRSIDGLSRNDEVHSNTDIADHDDIEVVKAENRVLKEKIRQMEQDQEMIMQLNQLLLEKLAQVANTDSDSLQL